MAMEVLSSGTGTGISINYQHQSGGSSDETTEFISHAGLKHKLFKVGLNLD